MPALQLMRTDERTNQKAEMVLFLNGKQLGTIGNGEKKDFNIRRLSPVKSQDNFLWQ